MKNTMQNILYSTLLLLSIAHFSIGAMIVSKEDSAINYTWITSGDLAEEREVMVNAFKKMYAPLSKEELPIDNLDTFLNGAFDDEVKDLANPQTGVSMLCAKKDDKTIGFISCNEESANVIYIRQMAVSPEFWGQGIGKKLVAGIQKKFPVAKKLVLMTRIVNRGAIAFYTALGFKKTDYLHAGLNPERYVGYEYIV